MRRNVIAPISHKCSGEARNSRLRKTTCMQMKDNKSFEINAAGWLCRANVYGGILLLVLLAFSGSLGCGGTSPQKQNAFFTSGNKEADQRASQRMAKAEELSGEAQGGGENGAGKSSSGKGKAGAAPGAATAPQKTALFDRLGGGAGLSHIIDDAMPRLLQDPRVNWDRKGVKNGGLFHHGPSVTWDPTPQDVAILKRHIIEFLTLATGGPAHYTGKEIKAAHNGMQISNTEFDAAVGDFKASLDRLKVPDRDQKELLAIIESTRPQIVEQR